MNHHMHLVYPIRNSISARVPAGCDVVGFRNAKRHATFGIALIASFLSLWAQAAAIRLPTANLAPPRATNCKVIVDGEAVLIETSGEHALVEWTVAAVEGPIELRFRLKTSVVGDDDQYIAYWLLEGEEDWKNFVRIPFHADGRWHDYRLPLAERGRLVGVRLAFAGPAHRVELAEPQIEVVQQVLPEEFAAERAALPASSQIEAGDLACQFDCKACRFVIHDSSTGRRWESEPVNQWLSLVGVEQIDKRSLRLRWYDFFTRRPLIGDVQVSDQTGATFSLEPTDPQVSIEAARFYPPSFTTDMTDGRFVFCDRSCGVLADQHDTTYGNWPLRVYGNTHCLDMPWVGLFDERRGDGLMMLVETPADAEVALVRRADGRHWPEVRWRSSLDSFRYRRAVSLRFSDRGGYVGLAKDYRRHLQETGRFKTMREKITAKPQAERLRGAPSLWGGRTCRDFIEQTRVLGIDRGIVGNCKDVETMHWLNKLGYLTGRYDSYTDILEGPAGFQTDDINRTAIRSRPGGPPKLGWKLRGDGGQMYWRSSALWLAAKQDYVDEDLRQFPYTARFIDVAAAAEPLEDYHPQHTFDRRQDLANRRALFAEMNRHGLVVGTEHGNDWVADQVEYFEGTMSGPFWWSSWDAGYLDPPKREQLSPNYLKFGMGYEHRVPLWELVFHDSVVTTWYWGDTAGMLYREAPELADRKDLMNILYGTVPLIWMNGADYRWPEDLHRMLRTYHDTCPLHQVVAFEELLEHEFLSEDRALQRTRFAGGTVAVVNFADEPRQFHAPVGAVTLAPRGYWVQGPGISQTKLWRDGVSETVIAKPDYLTVESAGRGLVANVQCDGRLTAFRTGDHRWNMFLQPNCDCRINMAAVTGWENTGKLCVRAMDKAGHLGTIVARADDDGIVHMKSSDEGWRFALLDSSDEPLQHTEDNVAADLPRMINKTPIQ